jgi:hypothetical protein
MADQGQHSSRVIFAMRTAVLSHWTMWSREQPSQWLRLRGEVLGNSLRVELLAGAAPHEASDADVRDRAAACCSEGSSRKAHHTLLRGWGKSPASADFAWDLACSLIARYCLWRCQSVPLAAGIFHCGCASGRHPRTYCDGHRSRCRRELRPKSATGRRAPIMMQPFCDDLKILSRSRVSRWDSYVSLAQH